MHVPTRPQGMGINAVRRNDPRRNDWAATGDDPNINGTIADAGAGVGTAINTIHVENIAMVVKGSSDTNATSDGTESRVEGGTCHIAQFLSSLCAVLADGEAEPLGSASPGGEVGGHR